MVEKTGGGRTAAEIVERARTIQVKHYQNWVAETTRIGEPEDVVSGLERDFRPMEAKISPITIKASKHGLLYRLTHR